MRMVASAKLHHTQGMTEAFLRYKDELEKIVDSLQLTDDSSMRTDDSSMRTVDPQGASQLSTVNCQLSTLLIPISSNSGLCGAFNSNIAKATMQHIQKLEAQGREVYLMPIGKKIAHELKKTGKDFNADFVDMLEKMEKSNTYADVATLVACVNGLSQSKELDSVEFLYHHFKSMGTQVIQVDSLQLTIDSSMRTDDNQMRAVDSSMRTDDQQGDSQLSTVNCQLSTYLTEPSRQELLTFLFPRLLNAKVYGILLDSLTSEHAARMLAMQTADDNANDLLKELTLLYNKTRQQSITNELIDIMSGKIGEH